MGTSKFSTQMERIKQFQPLLRYFIHSFSFFGMIALVFFFFLFLRIFFKVSSADLCHFMRKSLKLKECSEVY